VLLALDTATDHVSVALHNGAAVVASAALDGRRRHAEVLVPLIDEVLRDAGVDLSAVELVAVGVGPGAFTGLRVGLATARTLAQARGLECVGVSTLDALAHGAIANGSVGHHERFAVAIDARRREVFAAVIEHGARIEGPFVASPVAAAADQLANLTVVGDAVRQYPGVFAREIVATPSAVSIAEIVLAERAGTPTPFAVVAPDPVYVRRPDATEPTPRRRAPVGGA
jgi:tRNA threonylcarbamoyl adenosine modification protein YeaZ